MEDDQLLVSIKISIFWWWYRLGILSDLLLSCVVKLTFSLCGWCMDTAVNTLPINWTVDLVILLLVQRSINWWGYTEPLISSWGSIIDLPLIRNLENHRLFRSFLTKRVLFRSYYMYMLTSHACFLNFQVLVNICGSTVACSFVGVELNTNPSRSERKII